MILENEKAECVESISTGLSRTGQWRLRMDAQYPGDPRNRNAAEVLAKLAVDAKELSDGAWAQLQPHYDCASVHWRNAISQTTRQVGFVPDSKNFPFFIRNLIKALSQPLVA